MNHKKRLQGDARLRGKGYIGLTLDLYYPKGRVYLSVPGYIRDAHIKFDYLPHQEKVGRSLSQYGTKLLQAFLVEWSSGLC